MRPPINDELRRSAQRVLPCAESALFSDLMAFVRHRLEAAELAGCRLGETREQATQQRDLHAFLRECWEVLDGLGRLINLCAYPLFPDSGLEPPERMTRQCTLYTVRRDLHRHPEGAQHPLGVLLWEETRRGPHPAYSRLSFLYNLALFVPVPLPEGRLPGNAELPPHLRGLVRRQEVEGTSIELGRDEIVGWLRGFAARCSAEMARTLRRRVTR
jgi:hypothetical protein